MYMVVWLVTLFWCARLLFFLLRNSMKMALPDVVVPCDLSCPKLGYSGRIRTSIFMALVAFVIMVGDSVPLSTKIDISSIAPSFESSSFFQPTKVYPNVCMHTIPNYCENLTKSSKLYENNEGKTS